MIPPTLTARLAIFAVTTVATTVIPVIVQDRPILKWTWGRFGPVIETRIRDRIEDRLAPQPIPKESEVVVRPVKFDDGVQLTVPACIHPHDHCGHPPRRPLLNPNDYCRYHWWRAGPVRRVVSFPFRLLLNPRFCR